MKSDWQTVLARVLVQFTHDNDLAGELHCWLRNDTETYGLARGQWLGGDNDEAVKLLTRSLEDRGLKRKDRTHGEA